MHGIISTARLRSNRRGPASWPKKTDPLPLAFGDVARFAFPIKTLEMLGFATGAGRSTIKCWLNGTHAASDRALAICTAEIMRRLAGQ